MADRIPERSYGLPDMTVTGTPEVTETLEGMAPCPHCGCKRLYLIKVDVHSPLLSEDGTGVGTYVGCAACPWASPMMTRANPKPEEGLR